MRMISSTSTKDIVARPSSSLAHRVEIRVRIGLDGSCKYHKTGPVVEIGNDIVDADRPFIMALHRGNVFKPDPPTGDIPHLTGSANIACRRIISNMATFATGDVKCQLVARLGTCSRGESLRHCVRECGTSSQR